MKKVSLLSLLAVLAVSTAAQANVEDPLYTPAKGKLYSKTSVAKSKSVYNFAEEVGYGISNKFAIAGTIDYQNDTDSDADGFSFIKIGGKYRISGGAFITDAYIDYTKAIDEDVWGTDDAYILDAGVRFGKQTAKYTVAGYVGLNRIDHDLMKDTNNIAFGAKAAYSFDDRLSGSIGLDYVLTDDYNMVAGDDDSLSLTAQVNYQKGGLWSLYYTTELVADDVDDTIGLKYGIQF